jgi:hypothetical protein
MPALPRLGLPRLGFRVISRRRARSGVAPEAVLLAVLILVLGFLVALRVPF